MGYSTVHVDDIEPAGPGRAVRFVRRELGVEAFEHDEAGSGQEEVAVVVAGDGHWRVDGEEVPVRVGSFIRFDAGTVRCPVAGPDGMTFVAAGSPPGSYEPHGPF